MTAYIKVKRALLITNYRALHSLDKVCDKVSGALYWSYRKHRDAIQASYRAEADAILAASIARQNRAVDALKAANAALSSEADRAYEIRQKATSV